MHDLSVNMQGMRGSLHAVSLAEVVGHSHAGALLFVLKDSLICSLLSQACTQVPPLDCSSMAHLHLDGTACLVKWLLICSAAKS